MQSQITGSSGSEGNLKRVFSNVLDSTVSNAFSYIKSNLPLRPIRSIDVYYTYVHKFLDESNQIDKTTRELGNIKNYLSQFSGDIGNYNTRIQWYLIPRLSSLISSESTIRLIGSAGNNNSGNGLKAKYEAIKHKVVYCKASLQFENERLESISKNAKMLQKHLELIIAMLNKYRSNVQKLEEFRQKINQVKKKKEASMNYLKSVVKKVMCNFCEINRISNSLKCRIECVDITTINRDIALINSAIKAINNISSVIKSHLEYLFEVKLTVDCKIVNEVESFILGIVSEIHKKYCCLSSDISQIFSEEPNLSTLGESFKFCEIVECSTTTPTSTQSCERCQGSQGSQGCQCCLKNCQGLQQLLAKSNESNIGQKLNSIKKVICKLIDGQRSSGGTTCSQNNQCSSPCQSTGQPFGNSSECKVTTNIEKLVKCCLDEINKFQPSSELTCKGKEDLKCENTPTNRCQTTTGTQGTTNCSQSTSSTISNCNQLDKVKLCIDTMINKCNCQKLKDLINCKSIKSCVDVFKWVMVTNFRELFWFYLCFDKSILDQISCNINKLDEMKFYFREMLWIQSDIKSWIDCIKKEINEIPKQFKILENTMKSGIREMECEIEGVARNFIQCSILSNINTTYIAINDNNINNDGEVNDHNRDNKNKSLINL